MRTINLCVLSLFLLLIPWQISTSNHLNSPRPTPTEKACLICDEEESTGIADSAMITPAHIATGATPTPSDDCVECMIHADRIRALSTQAAREEAVSEGKDEVIHILLFWMESCPHCHDGLEKVLPPLQERYGELVEILLVEIVTVEDVDELYLLAADFGIQKEDTGVPFLIIGDDVLIGFDNILTRLPHLIQDYLAEGGVELPQVPGLGVFLERSTTQRFTLTGVTTPQSTSADLPVALSVDGAGLAITTLAGMVLALIFSAAIIVGAFRGAKIEKDRPRLDYATPILALVGVSIAGYLAYIETQAVPAFCGPIGDCNTVQSSPYAWVLGVVPVGLLGVLGYLGVVATWLWGRFRDDKLAMFLPIVIFGMTLFGVLVSIYLTYLEPFVIGAVCLWCLSSSVIITLLFLLSLRPMRRALEIFKA